MTQYVEFSVGETIYIYSIDGNAVLEEELTVTANEIGSLTQVAHRLVLERAFEAFKGVKFDTTDHWRSHWAGVKTFRQEGILNKEMAMLAVSGPLYSDKARAAVQNKFEELELARNFEAWECAEFQGLSKLPKEYERFLSKTPSPMKD